VGGFLGPRRAAFVVVFHVLIVQLVFERPVLWGS
jgi:hypothetical protein